MKSLVVPTLRAAVAAAAVASFVSCGSGGPTASNTGGSATTTASAPVDALAKLLLAYKKNPETTTILLSKETGDCKGEVGSDPVGNLPEKRVFWLVLNDTTFPCDLKDAYPKIKLKFTPNSGGQYPFPNQEVNSKHQGNGLDYIFEKIRKHGSLGNEVEYGLYAYKVYLLNGTTHNPDTPVLDPDLEVEGGNNLPTGGQKPPAPAKKP